MSENLGDALLTIRTNDGSFYTDVNRAKGASDQLGTSMDKTSGSSAKLATEMQSTARSADRMGDAMVRQRQRGRENVTSLGAQRAGMQQLSFQLNDVATMYALGARPMQIFASQSGQVIQAVQLMTGGTSKLAGFLGGPWGIAITSAVVVLTPFIGKLLEAEDALESVEFASDKLGDAQGVLRNVFDLTTGAIVTQRKELIALARAQATAGLVAARQRRSAAEREIDDISQGSLELTGGLGGGFTSRRVGNGAQDLVRAFEQGSIGADDAVARIQDRIVDGSMDESEGLRTMQALSSLAVERENENVFQGALDALDGEAGAVDQFMESGRKRRQRRKRRGPSQEDIDARFERDLISVTQAILSARLQMATSADERAELQMRQVEWDRRVQLEEIATDEQLSEAQKAELEAATNRLADAENEAIEFGRNAELERDIQALADERFQAETQALQDQLTLADTEAERKAIALRLLEAQEAHLRASLQAVILSETANDIEIERAEIALRALREGAGTRRAAVERANETEVDRYLRDLNQSPAQINEALDGIRIDGLEDLNDGLVDAIRGVESLGEVFKDVADQIISDLLRIAVRQSIIRPLAGALFGGIGGGPIDLLSGTTTFAGGFATGGLIPSGQFGLVGEEGPELAFSTPGGTQIMTNSDSKKMLGEGGGGISISVPVSLNAPGADRAALERLSSRIDRLQQDLPATIVQTVQDAGERKILSPEQWR